MLTYFEWGPSIDLVDLVVSSIEWWIWPWNTQYLICIQSAINVWVVEVGVQLVHRQTLSGGGGYFSILYVGVGRGSYYNVKIYFSIESIYGSEEK